MKILAIQFRYFGDAALLAPALRALREHFRDCALHVLVPAEVAPLFQHLPWLTRVWAMPRTRGQARLSASWPILRALRQEKFDRSVDFGGNDRGAILSLLCGARERLAPACAGGFLGRRWCYTNMIAPAALTEHESRRNVHILSAWNVPVPRSMHLEIAEDPSFASFAEEILPEPRIICHLATTQPKKEWPLRHWAELYDKASAVGLKLIFSTGQGQREQSLLAEFRALAPAAPVLPPIPDLAAFLAVLKRAELFVSGDTGPLHFAAGLGVSTVSLFGATSARLWAPLGSGHQLLEGGPCACDGHTAVCLAPQHCMAAISVDAVLSRMEKALQTTDRR